jgi:formamidopyrimidine-DNA glycosylase
MENIKHKGRPRKEDKYADIINIKSLFRNPDFVREQATKQWKIDHRVEVLKYHLKYNKEHEIYKMLGRFCDVCNKQVTNYSTHQRSHKHLNALEKSI